MNTSLYNFILDHQKNNELNIHSLSRDEKKELFSSFIHDEVISEIIQERIEDILQNRFLSLMDERGMRKIIDPTNGEISYR